jgi:hypothetical protein
MLTLLASHLFVAAAPLAPQGPVGMGSCPNERACDVPVRVEHRGVPQSCGVVLSVLGLDTPLWGDDCYPYRFVYPAHQQCHGKRGIGTYCTFEQNVSVLGERCHCERTSGGSSTGFSQWVCRCVLIPNAGTVTDDQTLACPHEPKPADATRNGGGQ